MTIAHEGLLGVRAGRRPSRAAPPAPSRSPSCGRPGSSPAGRWRPDGCRRARSSSCTARRSPAATSCATRSPSVRSTRTCWPTTRGSISASPRAPGSGRWARSTRRSTSRGAEVSSLRRRQGRLELRAYNPRPTATTLTIAGRQGDVVDLRGRVVAPFAGVLPLATVRHRHGGAGRTLRSASPRPPRGRPRRVQPGARERDRRDRPPPRAAPVARRASAPPHRRSRTDRRRPGRRRPRPAGRPTTGGRAPGAGRASRRRGRPRRSGARPRPGPTPPPAGPAAWARQPAAGGAGRRRRPRPARGRPARAPPGPPRGRRRRPNRAAGSGAPAGR